MRRAAAGIIAACTLLALAPPAHAVSRTAVRACRTAQPECWPVAFDFTPGGRIFYVERFTGQIRVYDPKTGRDRRWATVPDVATAGREQGLLGLALDPRWPRIRWVYVYFTHEGPLENRITRLRRRANGSLHRDLLARFVAADGHDGGVIHFGPDGRLYAVTGDADNPSNAQSLGTLAGKVLRMRPNGRAPGDNPFAGKRIWSYGHRNSFGFAFDPQTGSLWQDENGPDCNDELNRILKGRNYGWGPNASCPNTNQDGPDRVAPAWEIDPVIAPTGVTFCDGCGLGVEGQLLFGSYNDQKIRAATLTGDRTGIASVSTLFDAPSFVVAVETGPNGRIYYSDSRGIYRLTP